MRSKYSIVLVVLITFLVAAAGPATACDFSEPHDPDRDGHAFEPEPQDLPTTESSDTQTLSTTATETSDGEFEVHILNVGQADAAVIFSPEGETMIIDSGHWTDDGGTLIEFLEKHDVDHIDHLVATHAHSDHIGGHADLIEHFEEEKNGIGAAYDSGVPTSTNTYEDYMDAVEEYDVTLYEVEEGDELPFDGLEANVFNPPTDDPEYDYDESELHYNSMTILFEYEETSFLFTGDAEYHAEERMADTYGDELEATVYHAGHHGSSTSSNDHFLEVIDTQVTTISSNYDSQFGHPDNETLDRFDAHGVNAYWTGTHGTNAFVSDGEEFTIYAQNDASTDPLELRDDDESILDPTLEPKKVGTVSDEEFQGTTHQETLEIADADPETNAEHTWRLTDATNDFDGEVDSISVEYPTGTSLDDVDADDVTVLLDRDGDGSTDEISVTQDDYEGSEATFDLDARFNTNVEGEVVVEIDGVENPVVGDHTATLSLEGDDSYETILNFYIVEDVTLEPDPAEAETESDHTWTLTDPSDEFEGEADTITVDYSDETSLDGVDSDDVTVWLDRDGDGLTDEISVNQDDYDGDDATFDLSGMFNTSVEGEIQVEIDGVENPSDGVSEPTITLDGDDTHTETTELAVA